MYCNQCGEKNANDSKYCSSCGKQMQLAEEEKIDVPSQHETALPVNEKEGVVMKRNNDKSAKVNWLPYIFPIATLALVATGLLFYYLHEKSINEDVIGMMAEAEKVAISKDYEKASSLLRKAKKLRPQYSALHDDLSLIERAMKYEEQADKINNSIKKADFVKASTLLITLKEDLNKEDSTLFDHHKTKTEQQTVHITVGTIKKELNELTTIDQLGGKLSVLSTLPEKEASSVKNEIVNKIMQISSDKVEKHLAENQFSDAISTVDNGLQFAANHEKLLALKNRIVDSKTAFEKAEQEKIEKAMEVAALEDLENRTKAVYVDDFSVEIDEYGDLYISGNVQNIATRSLYNVTVEYSIYDEYNTYLRSGSTTVYPYYLNPGKWGFFEYTYYGVYQDVYVEIDNITWYLD
ncbi:FxLYD domain-containing protein [Sporosarcina sp. SAFN-015]